MVISIYSFCAITKFEKQPKKKIVGSFHHKHRFRESLEVYIEDILEKGETPHYALKTLIPEFLHNRFDIAVPLYVAMTAERILKALAPTEELKERFNEVTGG